MAESVLPLKVAVKVSDDPAFSAIVVSLTAKVTVGALSSSVIVKTTYCVPPEIYASPPDTLLIEIVAVSFPSYMESFVGVKFTVPVVLPALIVMSSIFPLPSV